MAQLSDHVGRLIEPTSANAGRKAYVAPHLLEYGSVAKLTQGNGSMTTDGSGSTMAGTKPRVSPGDAPAKRR